MPWELINCGIEPANEKRNGGAEMLRRNLEFLAIASDRTIVAVFDNDRAGNEQFRGLNARCFQNGLDAEHKQHLTKPAHAILLPVPQHRQMFVTSTDITQRYLSIEHYFSNEQLQTRGLRGPAILQTPVFEIVGNKVAFAADAHSFQVTDFDCFSGLFARIESVIRPNCPPGSLPAT